MQYLCMLVIFLVGAEAMKFFCTNNLKNVILQT